MRTDDKFTQNRLKTGKFHKDAIQSIQYIKRQSNWQPKKGVKLIVNDMDGKFMVSESIELSTISFITINTFDYLFS